jgi:hypothetical protein
LGFGKVPPAAAPGESEVGTAHDRTVTSELFHYTKDGRDAGGDGQEQEVRKRSLTQRRQGAKGGRDEEKTRG